MDETSGSESQDSPLIESLKHLAFSHQLLIDSEALACLAERGESEALELAGRAVELCKQRGLFMVTHELASELIEALDVERKAVQAVQTQVVVEQASREFDAEAKQVESKLRFTEPETERKCRNQVDDFVGYFRDRFKRLNAILRTRKSENPVFTTSKIRANANAGIAGGEGGSGERGGRRNSRLIGLVYDKRETKNGHLLVEIEDEEGTLQVLFAKESPLRLQANSLLFDEAVAVDGYYSNGLFIARGLTWPDVEYRQKNLIDAGETNGIEGVSIAFLSDLHVGSKKFMRENFQKFLKFLNGDCSEEEKKVAGKIKYLLIAGDLVDGIGAYPAQERELVTKDIYEQYEIFCELLKGIPEWIEVVAIPGNHDAVRIAEPQPSLPSELTKTLGERGNIHFAPSPTQVELHGVRVLMYHGNSIDSIVSGLNISKGYHHPELIGIEMLRRRHLAPVYGDKPLLPTERDALVISNPPDILHFGHVHKNGYAEYHGTTVINSGTWQEKTEYQIKQGHIVTPCLLPLYDLQTGVVKTLDFT